MTAPRLFAGRGVTLTQAQRWAGTLTAVCAYLSCAVSGELGLALLLLFPLALAGASWFGERFYDRGDWAWTVAIIGYFLVLAGQVAGGSLDVVLAAARFSELLCIHRLWHRRTQRDESLLLLLCLLMLCAGAALSAELAFGFAFLGFAVAGTWAMALTHLRFEIESGRGSAALLQSRRIATPALLGALGALAVMALFGAALVFFAFPRVTLGGLKRASRGTPAAGLGDRVDLSQHGVIADDPRVVLRARFPTAGPMARQLDMHWRARAFEQWTGRGWRAADSGITAANVLPQPPRRGRRHYLLADLEAVAGFSEGVVLTPEGWPISVNFLKPLTARPSSQRLYRNASGDLFYQPVEIGDVHYTVTVETSEPPIDALRGKGADYPGWLQPDLAVPAELDPRVRALAERLGKGKDPADAAMAIEHWLTASLAYTRELPGDVKDPVADFLFGRRKGHCELFSTAMVLMMRSLGIPARNVTGFYGGELTDTGYYAIRAGDAHSWVEVYFPGAGWVRFDPTPPGERGGQLDTLWSRVVLFWDTLQQRWRVLVVDYDLVAQAQAMKRVGEVINEASRRLSGKGGAAPRLRVVLAGLLALVAAGLLALGARRLRFLRLPGRAASRRLDADRQRAVELWRGAKARLIRAGYEMPPSVTAAEVARKLGSARGLVEAYLAARWGGAPLPAARARALLRELDSALAAARRAHA